MAGDEVAFFQFRNNAQETYRDIAHAMEGIRTAVGQPIDTGKVFVDTQGLMQGVGRIESELGRAKARIQELFAQVGSGAITKSSFNEQIRSTISGSLRDLPAMLAREAANMPTDKAAGIPFKNMGQQMAREYSQQLIQAVTEGNALAGKQLTNFKSLKPFQEIADFAGSGQLQTRGTDSRGYQAVSELQRLKLHQLAEDIMIRSGDPQIQGFKDLHAAGLQDFIPTMDKQLKPVGKGDNEQTILVRSAEVAQGIKTMTREADMYVGEAKRATAATLELETALGLLSSGVDRRGAVLFGPDGIPFTQTAKGAKEVDNPLAQNRFETEAANLRRIMDAGDSATNTGGKYRVLGDEVYRLTTYGAERVRHEAEVAEQLAKQAALLQKQMLAEEKLAAGAAGRSQKDAQNNSGVLGGFLGRFLRGDQSISTGIGGQIASAAAFSFAYGSLFALQAALRDTMGEFLDYQDSVTDLEVATRDADTVTSKWVNSLSEISRVSGSNMGEALDTAARGVRAFTKDGDSALSVRNAGDATTRSATELALIANKSLPDATGDLIASGTAFGLAPDQLQQVVDAVANAKRTVGGDASQISQGLSLISLSAQEAGYNLNEAAAVIGLVQARTDQSGTAIATRLTRIFQITSGSTGKQLAKELKVDPTLSGKDQLAAFADIYSNPNTSEPVKDRITSALGGTANLRELLPLLKEGDTLQHAYEEAFKNSGQATDEFNRKSENLVGTLKKIQGDISNLQVGLAKSGLFDIVGAGIKGIEPALHGITSMVNGINELTEKVPHLQSVLGVLIDIGIAAKVIGTIQGTHSRLFGGLGGGKAASVVDPANAARAREAELINLMVQRRLLAEGRYNEAIMLSSARRSVVEAEGAAVGAAGDAAGAAGSGRFAASRAGLATLGAGLVNPAVLITAGVALGFAAYGKQKEYDQIRGKMLDTSENSFAAANRGGDVTSASLKQAVVDVNAARGELEKTSANSGNRRTQDLLVGSAKERTAGLAYLSERVLKEEQLSVATKKMTVFGNGAIETVQQLADGMKAISDGGGTALTQLHALRNALDTPPPPPDQEYFKPEQLKGDIATTLQNTLIKSIGDGIYAKPKGWEEASASDRIKTGGTDAYGNPITLDPNSQAGALAAGYAQMAANQRNPGLSDPEEIAATIDVGSKKQMEKFNAALDAQLQARGLDGAKTISKKDKSGLVNAALDEVDFSTVNDPEALRASWFDAAMKGLGSVNTKKGVPNALLNAKSLDVGQVTSILNGSEAQDGQAAYPGLLAAMQNGLGAIPASDDGTLLERELGKNVATLRNIKSKLPSGTVIPQLEQALDAQLHQYRQTAVQNIEDLRQAAESRARSTSELRRVRSRFAKREVRAAGNDKVVLAQIFESLDRATVRSIIGAAEVAATATKKAAEAARAAVVISANVVTEIINGLPYQHGSVALLGDPEADAAEKRANAALKHLNALKDAYAHSTINEETATSPEDDGMSRAVAAAQMRAARLGGGLAPAQAALVAAREAVNKAKPNTVAWMQAMAGLYEAQRQYSDALVEYHTTLAALEGDNTDPVEQARDALQIAREKLRRHRAAGAGKDVLAADKLGVQDSEAALQQAAFQQRLSDMQTAEQLGRISQATYLRYLQHEHDRLQKIHGRTRQQQDQLNTIDQAIQEANNSMDAQFNFGSINTRGLVYQARRWATEQRAQLNQSAGIGPQHMAASMNQDVRIYIDGADTAKVKKVIQDTLGGASRTRTAQSRRR